jgi:uncharacterized protein YfkK (UPF0435 family)
MPEKIKINNDNLRIMIKAIKSKINTINDELNETDIDNITLDDLIHYKSNIKTTITLSQHLSKYLELLNIISENYFLALSAIESNQQVQERCGTDSDMSNAITNHILLENEKRINVINDVVDSDEFKRMIALEEQKGKPIKEWAVFP